MSKYVPRRGDLVWVTFHPQAGHEQRGRRPALVISKTLFNKRMGLAVVCPVTNTERKVPFHVPIPEGSSLTGFVMVEQIKSVDCAARRVMLIEAAPTELLNEVLSILDAIVY